MGLIWGDPYRSAQLKFMWGPSWGEPYGPIWSNPDGPMWGNPHGPMCGNPYGPAQLKFMWNPNWLYFMGLPTWVTQGTYVGQPIWACPAKTYLGPTNSCYLGYYDALKPPRGILHYGPVKRS